MEKVVWWVGEDPTADCWVVYDEVKENGEVVVG